MIVVEEAHTCDTDQVCLVVWVGRFENLLKYVPRLREQLSKSRMAHTRTRWVGSPTRTTCGKASSN